VTVRKIKRTPTGRASIMTIRIIQRSRHSAQTVHRAASIMLVPANCAPSNCATPRHARFAHHVHSAPWQGSGGPRRGVSDLPDCRSALRACLGQLVRLPSSAPWAFFRASAARVRSAISAPRLSERPLDHQTISVIR